MPWECHKQSECTNGGDAELLADWKDLYDCVEDVRDSARNVEKDVKKGRRAHAKATLASMRKGLDRIKWKFGNAKCQAAKTLAGGLGRLVAPEDQEPLSSLQQTIDRLDEAFEVPYPLSPRDDKTQQERLGDARAVARTVRKSFDPVKAAINNCIKNQLCLGDVLKRDLGSCSSPPTTP